ncbi:MAG: hypothetical protein M1829_005527 [Trizodia sp. TS-e1964]|nr:MAG: hypothetical protein M1829_005527 [Trizodia sp. TS-e1964]
MFRLYLEYPPPEKSFPTDLKGLGYFVNKQDKVKAIADPTQDFKYWVFKNERSCELRKEAFHECLRKIVLSRFMDLGFEILSLPFGTKPQRPQVPILISPNIEKCKRVLVVFGEASQDLGIWAYRILCDGEEGGITAGSALRLVNYLKKSQPETGVIIANLGQQIWSRQYAKAITFSTWYCLPRRNACEEAPVISSKNRIPLNETLEAHVKYVFENVIKEKVNAHAEIDIIGVTDGATEALKYLGKNWANWKGTVKAMAFGAPIFKIEEIEEPSLREFIRMRCRAFVVSQEPKGELIRGPPGHFYGCPAFSSGEPEIMECIMPAAQDLMLEFLAEAANAGLRFKNVSMPASYEDDYLQY